MMKRIFTGPDTVKKVRPSLPNVRSTYEYGPRADGRLESDRRQHPIGVSEN